MRMDGGLQAITWQALAFASFTTIPVIGILWRRATGTGERACATLHGT